MCELCSSDPIIAEKARQHAAYIANRLEQAAGFYQGIANGTEKPHSDRAKNFSYMVKVLIRELVEELDAT